MLQVLHVVESMGGGVAAAVGDYVRSQPDAEHHLAMATRTDAPLDPRLVEGFATVSSLPAGHVGRVRWLRSHVAGLDGDVAVHAHSSFGGFYARVACSPRRVRVVYTPHCYGFERRDLRRFWVVAIWLVEWVLARRTTVVAACSPREAALARRLRRGACVVFVPNVPPALERPDVPARAAGAPPLLVGSGRLSPQKDASFFARAVLALRASGRDVEARWIGGGDPDRELELEAAGVSVSGWLPREQVVRELASADVYLHSAAWEGFPVAILEAAILETSTVVRDLPCFTDWRFPFVVDAPDDLVSLWDAVTSRTGRVRAQEFARELREKSSVARQARALTEVYGTTEKAVA